MIDFSPAANAALTTGTSPASAPVERTPSPRRDIGSVEPKRPPAPGKIRITFEVYEEFAPALRSAVEEISNDIGARLTGSHRFAKEQALTDAAVSLGALRAAVFARIPAGDPNYV